jgi:1,4-alpha-glucan branching enzyme
MSSSRDLRRLYISSARLEKEIENGTETQENQHGRPQDRIPVGRPSAREVDIVGDFNGWESKAHPKRKGKNGVWTQTVALSPDRYEYRVYADGQWVNDPKIL